MLTYQIIVAVALLCILTWALTHIVASSRMKSRLALKDEKLQQLETSCKSMELLLEEKQRNFAAALQSQKDASEAAMNLQKSSFEQTLNLQKEASEQALQQQKEASENALQQQLQSIRSEMTAQTEKLLKEREESLSAEAKKTFESISDELGKEVKNMKEAFDANKEAHLKNSATMQEHLDNAVRNLAEQTVSIGNKAETLANAMRGQHKYQGCWGETVLNNIFETEGLVEGRDYDREATLRDQLGFVLKGESDKRMRPDFILHYPDNTDIIVDSKVSLDAFYDYCEAQDDSAKENAQKRNLEAIRTQVGLLSKKEYFKNLNSSRKTLDYVVMFIPNYGALQLAKQSDENIWRDAYRQNVLITTEETLMPFLRMIRTAWISQEQVKNQKQILQAAQNMLDRVSDFCKYHDMMGKKLEEAQAFYDKCRDKIADRGQSILVSANQLLKFGVPDNPNKPLPEPRQVIGESSDEGNG